MNAILERQIHAARLLAAQDPPKRTGRGRDPRTGREFTFAPASEYMRVLRAVLPKAGLILRPVGAKITPEGLERTYRLTHDPAQTGASEEWTTVTPLDRSVPPDLAAVWARTHSLVAVVKDLLLPDEEDVPDPSERAPSRPETLEDRDAQTERVHAAREERRRATRPTRATRAANSLAGHLTGAAPVVELGQAEQEQEERRAQEAERAADERAAASPSAPVADPDWLDEEREQVKHILEDRLRVELERTRDQIQTRAGAHPSEAAPAPGALPGAALSTDDTSPGDLTPPPAPASSTAPDAVSGAAPLNEADEATDEELGAEVARQFLARTNDDDSTDAGPSPAGGSTVEESSPAPEPVSPGQGASTACACGHDGDRHDGRGCGVVIATGVTGRPVLCPCELPGPPGDEDDPPEEPSSDRPSGEPALCGANGCSERAAHPWTLCPAHATAVGLLAPECPGERDDMCWSCGGEGRDPMTGALCVTCGATGEVQVPDWRCSSCGETCVDTEGEVCGLCVTTEARCAECDVPLAADSTECPNPECPSNERQGTAAEALDEVGSWGESPKEVRRAASPPQDGPALTMTYADGSTATIPVPPRAAKRLEASIDSGDSAEGRKGRARRWKNRPLGKARKDAGPCAECGATVEAGSERRCGVEPDPSDPGRRLSKRGQPIGVVHESCVKRLERGEDPRAQEETSA